jgi:phage/plasmid-associated DNA primase
VQSFYKSRQDVSAFVRLTAAKMRPLSNSDLVAQFVSACCQTGDGRSVLAVELYAAWQAYAHRHGLDDAARWSLPEFTLRLRAVVPGLQARRPGWGWDRRCGKTFVGVALRPGL